MGGRGAHGGPGRARRRGPRGGGGLAAQALRRACCSGTAPPPPGKWNSSAAVPCRVGPPGTDGQSVSRVFRPPRAGTRCFRRLRSVPAPPAGRLRFPGQRRQRASESLSRTVSAAGRRPPLPLCLSPASVALGASRAGPAGAALRRQGPAVFGPRWGRSRVWGSLSAWALPPFEPVPGCRLGRKTVYFIVWKEYLLLWPLAEKIDERKD